MTTKTDFLMNTEQLRADFEVWASQYTNYPQKYDQIPAWLAYQAGYQAALASPEVQARQWQPIETAPKDGTEIIVFHPEGGVCAAFCPDDGFAWHCMDGMNTVIGKKSRKSIPRMTSFVNPPTHWMPLPAPPADATTEKQK